MARLRGAILSSGAFAAFPQWDGVKCLLMRYPPSRSIFWNDGVRAGLPSKSLRNKDLYVKSSGIRSYGFQIAFGTPALGRVRPTGGAKVVKERGPCSYSQIANCTFHIISALASAIKKKATTRIAVENSSLRVWPMTLTGSLLRLTSTVCLESTSGVVARL